MKPLLILIACSLTLTVFGANYVTVTEPVETQANAGNMKLPKGCKLEVIKVQDGVLTCLLAGQSVLVPADKTDYSAATPVKPTRARAGNYAAARSLFDTLGTAPAAAALRYRLPWYPFVTGAELAVPAVYDKASVGVPVLDYYYALRDGVIVGMDIYTPWMKAAEYDAMLATLQRQFPPSGAVRKETPAVDQLFPAVTWLSGQLTVEVFCATSLPKQSGAMPDDYGKFHLILTQLERRGLAANLRAPTAGALDYNITLHEVPRELAEELLRNPEARHDEAVLNKVSMLRKRASFKGDAVITPEASQLRVETDDGSLQLIFGSLHAVVSNKVCPIEALNLQPLNPSEKSKLPAGPYHSRNLLYAAIGETLIIPLFPPADIALKERVYPVALVKLNFSAAIREKISKHVPTAQPNTPLPPPAPAVSTSDNLLDLPGTLLNDSEILYAFKGKTSESGFYGRHVIPKRYDKNTGGLFAVQAYSYRLAPSGVINFVSISGGYVTEEQYELVATQLQKIFPPTVTPQWEERTAQIGDRFPSVHWNSTRGFINFGADSPLKSSAVLCRLRASIQRDGMGAFPNATLPDLHFVVDVREVARDFALELTRSPELRASPETIERMKSCKRLLLAPVDYHETKAEDLYTTVKADSATLPVSLYLSREYMDVERGIFFINHIRVKLAGMADGKLDAGWYRNYCDDDNVVELRKTVALPLKKSGTTTDAEYLPVALVTLVEE